MKIIRFIRRLFGPGTNHLHAAVRLFFSHRAQIRKANTKFFKSRKKKDISRDLKNIEDTDLLFTANIGYLFSVMTLAFVPLLIAGWYLGSLPLESTTVSVDVIVSDVRWIVRKPSEEDGDWELKSNDSVNTAVNYDLVYSQSFSNYSLPAKGLVEFIPKKKKPVTLSSISLMEDNEIELRKPIDGFLTLVQNTKGNERVSTAFKYTVECTDCTIKAESGQYDTKGFYQAVFEKHVKPGAQAKISFPIAKEWTLPARLFTDSISFLKSEPAAKFERLESSVISGTLRMLDTADSTIRLYERDQLQLVFPDTTELFIKTTDNGIAVHLEGKASVVRCGPAILGEENNKMPTHAKVWMKQKSHYLGLIAIFLPLVLSLFIRQRRSI